MFNILTGLTKAVVAAVVTPEVVEAARDAYRQNLKLVSHPESGSVTHTVNEAMEAALIAALAMLRGE
jgi:hypothetical protein